jgi:hypothetical protein
VHKFKFISATVADRGCWHGTQIPRGPGEISEAWTIDFREAAPHLMNSTVSNDGPLSAVFARLSAPREIDEGTPWEVTPQIGKNTKLCLRS